MWTAYRAERARLLDALQPAAGNAIVYSGDTHAAFTGMLANAGGDYVGAEFSSPGVTSPDRELDSLTPLELHNAAQLAGNQVRTIVGTFAFLLTQQCHDARLLGLTPSLRCACVRWADVTCWPRAA